MPRRLRVEEYSQYASGPYVGKPCGHITHQRRRGLPDGYCTELATFAITPYGKTEPEMITCGKHYSVATREVSEKTGKAIIVQMIPVPIARRYR